MAERGPLRHHHQMPSSPRPLSTSSVSLLIEEAAVRLGKLPQEVRDPLYEVVRAEFASLYRRVIGLGRADEFGEACEQAVRASVTARCSPDVRGFRHE